MGFVRSCKIEICDVIFVFEGGASFYFLSWMPKKNYDKKECGKNITKTKLNQKKFNLQRFNFIVEMSASTIFGNISVRLNQTKVQMYKVQLQNNPQKLAINFVTIGGKKLAWPCSTFIQSTSTDFVTNNTIQHRVVIYSQPTSKSPQEILLFWLNYKPIISEDKVFMITFNHYTSVKLMQNYLVFKYDNGVKIFDLNMINEIVHINYGKKTHKGNVYYVIRFIMTSTNDEESIVDVVSDTVIKIPSHAKITELTEDQHKAMKRAKLFKQ